MLRFGLLLLLVAAGCVRTAALPTDAGPEADAPIADAGAAPLTAPWLERLDLPKNGLAYVTPPLGATEPRPVIVAVHGAMDNPGAMCAAWRVIADGYAFVVCPAGLKTGKDLYTWSSSEHISAAIDAALAAVRAKYGAWMNDAPMVYAAFSQGANLAGPVLSTLNHGRFVRAQLTEGGYQALADRSAARAYEKNGGTRVLYTCAQSGCAGSYGASKATLSQVGIEPRIEAVSPFGHSMTPQVRTSINAALPWLIEGLPEWSGYPAFPKLAEH